MSKLTERTPMPNPTTNDDLLHIVDVDDTSGGAAGTSYKAKRSQVATQTFADDAARAAAVPGFIGQMGVQLDYGTVYRATSVAAGGWQLVVPGYKYIVLLSQSGTNAPTITQEIFNTTGETPISVYDDVGGYILGFSSSFSFQSNKVSVIMPNSVSGIVTAYLSSPGSIYINSKNFSGTPTNGILSNSVLMVEHYI